MFLAVCRLSPPWPSWPRRGSAIGHFPKWPLDLELLVPAALSLNEGYQAYKLGRIDWKGWLSIVLAPPEFLSFIKSADLSLLYILIVSPPPPPPVSVSCCEQCSRSKLSGLAQIFPDFLDEPNYTRGPGGELLNALFPTIRIS